MTSSTAWDDFPRKHFAIVRSLQIALCVVCLIIVFLGNGWVMGLVIYPLLVAIVWTIVTFSVFLSGQLGPALLTAIMDCLLALAYLIPVVLATVIYAYNHGNSVTIVFLVLNYICVASFFYTFYMAVRVHRVQKQTRSNPQSNPELSSFVPHAPNLVV